MGVAGTYAGLLLTGRRWVAEMLGLNLETGRPGEPPAAVWDDVLDMLRLTPEQVGGWGAGGWGRRRRGGRSRRERLCNSRRLRLLRPARVNQPPSPPFLTLPQGLMLLLLRRWWQDTMAALARQRQELAKLALQAPHVSPGAARPCGRRAPPRAAPPRRRRAPAAPCPGSRVHGPRTQLAPHNPPPPPPAPYCSTPPPRLTPHPPQDYELQERVLAGLDRAQGAYVRHGVAANVVIFTALLSPLQCAEVGGGGLCAAPARGGAARGRGLPRALAARSRAVPHVRALKTPAARLRPRQVYVQAWPFMPTMTAVLDRWHARAGGGGWGGAAPAPSAAGDLAAPPGAAWPAAGLGPRGGPWLAAVPPQPPQPQQQQQEGEAAAPDEPPAAP
jgi:hypothetical protein